MKERELDWGLSEWEPRVPPMAIAVTWSTEHLSTWVRVLPFYHLIQDRILLKTMKRATRLGTHACNPSTWEAEAGR
jgi:hypothetical protein